MPGFDRTGPDGQGPLSGRGMGKCRGEKTADEVKTTGRRPGRGLGLGRKNRNGQMDSPGRGRNRKPGNSGGRRNQGR
ncbi:MAG: DUF5320 domain-containing protein [Prolixibacteraceae bacterium]|nr:DUF5320 domain-containing protein [Prolixibacteraceae bacterium]MBN2774376.1 DUF5320 domain-containing protein [Prolixibacteraceae bacterium]